MTLKIKHVVLLLSGLGIISCNSDDGKKTETTNAQVAAVDTANKNPSADFSAYENKIMEDSLNIELRAYLASNYYSAGELEKAANHFLVIYRQDPKNIIALRNLGNIYYDAHQDDNAIRFYEKALAVHPDDINMRCDLATCYSRINKVKKAMEILRENIKSDKNHAQSHYNLSVILKQAGNISEAEKEMEIYKGLTSAK